MRKSDIGARFVRIVWVGVRVGAVVRRRESAKWEPTKRDFESSETRTEGMEVYRSESEGEGRKST